LGKEYLVKSRKTGKCEISEKDQAKVKKGSGGSGRGGWRPRRSSIGLIPPEQIKHSIQFISL
jgi:hypothetical protein